MSGHRKHHAPECAIFCHGDPADVRAVGLSPKRREALARSLRTVRNVRRGGFYGDAGDFADKCAQLRREAIMSECADRTDAEKHDGEILTRACARYLGQTDEEFVRGALHDKISSVIERATAGKDTGEGLPGFLTRQELAAMATPLLDWREHPNTKGKERKA